MVRVTGKKLCPHRAVAIAVSHMDKFKGFIFTFFLSKVNHKWYLVVQVLIKNGRKRVTIRSPLQVR